MLATHPTTTTTDTSRTGAGRHRVARRPDVETTITIQPWQPPVTVQVAASAECGDCGEQLADTAAHRGPVVAYADRLFGSTACAEKYAARATADERIEGPRLSPTPPHGLVDATRVPMLLALDINPAASLAELAVAARRLLDLEDGSGTFVEAELVRADIRRILAAIGGAA